MAFVTLVRLRAANDIRIGVGGPVGEAILRAWFVLAQAVGPQALERRAAFEADRRRLIDETRRHSRYLRDVVLQYTADQREGTPRVVDHVHIDVDRVAGALVLSPAQAQALVHELRRLDLRGQHTLSVVRVDRTSGVMEARIGGSVIPLVGRPSSAGSTWSRSSLARNRELAQRHTAIYNETVCRELNSYSAELASLRDLAGRVPPGPISDLVAALIGEATTLVHGLRVSAWLALGGTARGEVGG